jgi:hypothetical protein
MSPVTQTAEVAVKSATIGSFHWPLAVAKGSSNNPVPMTINIKNPAQMVRGTVISNSPIRSKSC